MKRRIFKRGLTNAKLGSNLSLAIKNEKKLAGKRLQAARRRSKTLRCSQYGMETVNGSNFWRSPENRGPKVQTRSAWNLSGKRTEDARKIRQSFSAVQCSTPTAGRFGFSLWHFFFEPNMRDRLAARQAGFFVLQIDCRQKKEKRRKCYVGNDQSTDHQDR